MCRGVDPPTEPTYLAGTVRPRPWNGRLERFQLPSVIYPACRGRATLAARGEARRPPVRVQPPARPGTNDFTFALTAQARARGWDAAFGAGVVRVKDGQSGRGERI